MSAISARAGNLLNDIAMIKRAYKQADNSRGEQEASKLLSNDTGVSITDFLPTPWGLARAGRATTLGNAMGQDVDYSVSDPAKSNVLHTLGGGAIGALGGAALGGLSGDRDGLPIGALLGGGLGALTGGIYNSYNRMSNIDKIRKDYVNAVNSKKKLNLDRADPKLTALGGLLGFAGGQHRGGAADAYSHLTGGSAEQSGLRDLNRAAHFIPFAQYATPFGNAAEGVGAAQTIEEANRRRGKRS